MLRSIVPVAISVCISFCSSAQLFQAPTRISFGNISVTLEPAARDIVQEDVYALLSNRATLNTRLDRAALYYPIVENILAEENVPNDFKYLVMQESGLAPDAVSTSNAVGFWQFKKETATDYGLRVDDEIDERKNIHASTRAAARYLKKNNITLNNWIATLYSYYLGLGGIRNLVPANWNGAKEITLNERTDRYILRCLAHKMVYENELKGYRSAQVPFYEYKMSGGKTFTQIADQLGVDEVELRRYNRWVGGSKVPQDRPYTMLVVPTNAPQPVIASTKQGPVLETRPQQINAQARPKKTKEPDFPVLNRITPTGRNQSKGPILYEINGKKGILAQEGDTYETIARRGDIRSSRFLSRNDLNENDAIIPGKVYYLQKKSKRGPVQYHTLQHDQSAWEVSQMYGVRLSSLLRHNRIVDASQPLQPGRVLWLQKTRPCKTAIEVVPLPDAEPVLEAEKPVSDVAAQPTTRPAEVTVPTTPPASRPQQSSGRVVLVDENGQVVTGNQPKTPVNESKAVTYPKPERRTETAPATTYPATPESIEGARARRITGPATPAPTRTVEAPAGSYHVVEAGETFYGIARKYNLTPSQLRDLNGLTSFPVLRSGEKIQVRGSKVTETVPAKKEERIAREDRVVPETPKSVPDKPVTTDRSALSYHIVQAGETFYSIARKYNLTPEQLRDINGFSDFPRVNVGDRVELKSVRGVAPKSSAPAAKVEGSQWTSHTVEPGETLFGIARKYQVKTSEIVEWNSLKEGKIKSGQKLRIQKP